MQEFPLEKILEVGIDQYLESKGTKISQYELKGVIVEAVIPGYITQRFQEEVPKDTEVVVNYHVEFYENRTGANAYGIALVPKK